MITLTAKINLMADDKWLRIFTAYSKHPNNNISKSLYNVVGKKQIKSPFILGSSKLGYGDTFEDSVDYFISQNLYDGNNEEIYLELETNANSITISFDTLNNRYPNSIIVNDKEYFNDDAIFTVGGLKGNFHKIRIKNWNTINTPIVISGIYININIDIDYRNLISLNRSIFDRSDVKLPSYGIISNTGNIEFNDLDGEIKDYAEQLLLASDLKVKIRLNNTLSNTYEEIGVFETRDWDYNNDNRRVSVSLKDDLEEWQDIQIEMLLQDEMSLKELYIYLYEKTPTKYNMLAFYSLDSATREVLNNIKIKYPMLNSGSLWEQWTKICEVAQAHIYKLDNGTTTFVYKGGN